MGFRSEIFFGEGYRNASDVMAHEVFELRNTDILRTLSSTILKNTPIGEKLEILEEELNNDCVAEGDEECVLYNLIEEAFEDEDIGIKFFNEVLEEIKKVTGRSIKYVLWLCDSKEGVYHYDSGKELTDEDIDEYENSDIVLSDLGSDGKLYGYEKMPEKK